VRENCTLGLSGGRRPALRGASSDPTPLKLFLIEVDEDFQIIPTQIKLREIDCTIRTTMLLVDCLLAI
jgi:hypothetical protein